MNKDTFLLVVGLLVFLTPLVGVPSEWKDVALFVLGGSVVLVSLVCRLQRRRGARTAEHTLHVQHDPEVTADVRSI